MSVDLETWKRLDRARGTTSPTGTLARRPLGYCDNLLVENVEDIIARLERADRIETAARRVRVDTGKEPGPTVVVVGLEDLVVALEGA